MVWQDFPVPIDAVPDLEEAHITNETIRGGATMHHVGFAQGVAFRFYTISERNAVKSLLAGVDVYEDIDVIEYFNHKLNKPAHRLDKMNGVKEEPEFRRDIKTGEFELDYNGNKIPMVGPPTASHPRGEMLKKRTLIKDENGWLAALPREIQKHYTDWKRGASKGGTALDSWPYLEPHHRRAFKEMQVFSVEQLASLPPQQASHLPPSLKEAFDAACRWVASKENRFLSDEQATALLEAKQQLAKQDDQLAMMRAALAEHGIVIGGSVEAKPEKPKKEKVK